MTALSLWNVAWAPGPCFTYQLHGPGAHATYSRSPLMDGFANVHAQSVVHA